MSGGALKIKLYWVVYIIPLAIWLTSIDDPLLYLNSTLPPGQLVYVISKLLALYAFLFLTIQLVTTLLRVDFSRNGHVILGLSSFFLITSHVICFISAVSLRGDHIPWHLLAPNFSSGFYSLMVSIGAISFWLLFIAVCAGVLSIKGKKVARKVHYFVLPVYLMGFAHGLFIGTETGFSITGSFYFSGFLIVLFSLMHKLLKERQTSLGLRCN